jgi:hypothetical protein
MNFSMNLVNFLKDCLSYRIWDLNSDASPNKIYKLGFDIFSSIMYIVTCIRGVTIRRRSDWMIGFVAIIHSTRNYR